MAKQLEIDETEVNNLIECNNYVSLADYLKNSFKLERNSDGTPLPYIFSEDAVEVLHSVLKKIKKSQEWNDNITNLSKELFRCLRNYVINTEVQNCLINNTDFLHDVNDIIICLKNLKAYEVLQIVLQFLINMIVSNKSAGFKCFELYSNYILDFLKEKVLVYECSALLYNFSLYQLLGNLDIEICICILELYESNNNVEFLHFLLELFITYEYFWIFYETFSIKHRLILLGIIRQKQIEGSALSLPLEGIAMLTKQFIKSANITFQTTVSKDSDLEPFEVSQLLEVISSFCGNEQNLKALQNDKDLLINCGVLLINIHNLGKESQNCFSSIQRLGEIREPNENIRQHPAFGFKGSLIRIIGNLCWKNKIIQDLVREAELIPVILDCCNMDARNPFIIQWCIFAIRNLCENNLQNQELIAGMHQQGTVSSATLEEMGLTLHSDGGNSLKIVPLDAIKNVK